MARTSFRYRWVAALAVVVSIAANGQLFAQSKNWNAENLSSPFPAPQTEPELIEQLRTAPEEGKAIACKQLSIYGSKAAVPELAKLLSDEHMSSWARIALEAIPDQEAETALVEAAGKLKGKLLVGVINSLGARRSEQAIAQLAECLKDQDEQVASAAAVAIGKIGNEHAVHTLHEAFADATPAVRSAMAEGGILCAERMIADGNNDLAVQIYDVIRTSDLPKQRILEATRGAIVARGDAGIPMLVEQLQSSDRHFIHIALSAARELKGSAVVEALAEELADASSEKGSLIIYAIGDREDVTLPKAVLQAATSGDESVRLAAIELVGRHGDASAVPTLLEIATGSDVELSQAAKTALAGLPGNKVDSELAARLRTAKGKALITLIELTGERRVTATPELVKAMKSTDDSTRTAALAALGETVEAKDLNVLITTVIDADGDADRDLTEKALHAAAIRMKDREATAAELDNAMSKASTPVKVAFLRILGDMGGPTALETIAKAVKSGDDKLQDAGTAALGKWMTADAGPVLLTIVKDSSTDKKYQIRALRGYLRIARQLKLPDDERIEMCRQALKVAERPEERALALDALKRCPSAEAVQLASSLVDDKQVRDTAVETAIYIGEQIKDKDPAAAKKAGQKALEASPPKELADRARALTSP